MGQVEEARQALEESLSLNPTDYQTLKELLAVLVKLDDINATIVAMGQLLRLDPQNPTVFNDCLRFANGDLWSKLLKLIDTLKTELVGDTLAQGNCDFYAGQLLLNIDPKSAKQRFLAARQAFRLIHPAKHQVFAALRLSLRHCNPDRGPNC
jgi:tetratricopeptide (TPR) repeat protein